MNTNKNSTRIGVKATNSLCGPYDSSQQAGSCMGHQASIRSRITPSINSDLGQLRPEIPKLISLGLKAQMVRKLEDGKGRRGTYLNGIVCDRSLCLYSPLSALRIRRRKGEGDKLQAE